MTSRPTPKPPGAIGKPKPASSAHGASSPNSSGNSSGNSPVGSRPSSASKPGSARPTSGAPNSAPQSKSREVSIPREELDFTYARSSGAGGQNVNKVNSKAILRWNPQTSSAMTGSMRERFFTKFGSRLTNDGELILMSDVHRDQGRNAAECLEKLKEMIKSIAVPPKKRVATKPTFGSKVRRLNSKKAQSDKKQGRRNRGDD